MINRDEIKEGDYIYYLARNGKKYIVKVLTLYQTDDLWDFYVKVINPDEDFSGKGLISSKFVTKLDFCLKEFL